MNVSTETSLRVWNDDEGVCLEIGLDTDGLGVEVRTGSDAASLDWFGKISLPLGSPEFANALADAIKKMAADWSA